MPNISRRLLSWRQTCNCFSQNRFIVGKLLEKTDLAAGGHNRNLVILACVAVDETRQYRTCVVQTAGRQVQIVDEKENQAPTIQWHRCTGGGCHPPRGRELCLFVRAAGFDQLKEGDLAGLATYL